MSMATSLVLVTAALLSGSVVFSLAQPQELDRRAELLRKGDLQSAARCSSDDPLRPATCNSEWRTCFVISEARSLNRSVLMRIPVRCPSRPIVEVATISGSGRSARPLG